MYKIRLCRRDELKQLQDFLSQHWSKGHIFTHSEELLLWQHGNTLNDAINFVVAFNEETCEFDAILGYIPTNQYDAEMEAKDVWLAIWKVKDECSSSGIGLQLLMYMKYTYKASSIGVLGISDVALEIYKALGYEIGALKHFYIKNDSFESFEIAAFKQSIREGKPVNNTSIKKLTLEEFNEANIDYNYSPHKSKTYYINRYHDHQFYKYDFYGVIKNEVVFGVFVAREVIVKKAKCIRIVDWLGDFVDGLYEDFQTLLRLSNAEYIDLLCKVPDENGITNMGFLEKDYEQEIVPDYFEPYLKRNVTIDLAYQTNSQIYAVFKGDSDQDRPSKIETKA